MRGSIWYIVSVNLVTRPSLPIDDVIPEVIDALSRHGSVVLSAPTGSGKTTRVPPALLRQAVTADRSVIVLEPRRIAARAAARRIAAEWPCRLGGCVGYQVRHDRKAGPQTRLLVVTEGVLVRMLQRDPFLEGTGVVVFDEFHERRLDSDLAMSMVRQVQLSARPDLGVVVMSATLRSESVAAFLGDCPVVTSAGRMFPVRIEHLPASRSVGPEQAVIMGIRRALDETKGDLLVFLPGVGEIRQAERRLAKEGFASQLAICPLYGNLAPEEQDAALEPSSRRKIVLATNVAETSITIRGVEGVVDTGTARSMHFDPGCGLNRLELRRISRASAEQRAGRAGRERPGYCVRLWSEAEHKELLETDVPEIRRLDLAQPVLELLAWGESDPASFGWLEAPGSASVERAVELLRQLGAVDDRGVTKVGRSLARFPTHPRLARLIVAGHECGHSDRACLLAAMLSERAPFRRLRAPSPSEEALPTDFDSLDRLVAVERFESDGNRDGVAPWEGLSPGAARNVLRQRDHLRSAARTVLGKAPEASMDADEALGRAMLTAFPDRLARRRDPGSRRAVLVGGRGICLAKQSGVVAPELFVCVDLDAGRRGDRSEAWVRAASTVERDWLDPDEIATVSDAVFDTAEERVVTRQRETYRGLVLSEQFGVAVSEHRVAEVLAEAASSRLDRALALDEPAAAEFLARWHFLAAHMPELELPPFDEPRLRSLVPSLCVGCRSFEDLRKVNVSASLRHEVTFEQSRALAKHAPARIEVPSGHHRRVAYRIGEPPVLAVRIQELFGWTDTPRIAAGRVPVLLHLLAPNMRPQQVTDDLRGFWERTYGEVRKELRARYPKHDWPEDPATAKAKRRRRRRSS